jgi:hypothetical protein
MWFLSENNKNKRFNFKSVYYDPEKEDLNQQSKKTMFAKEMYARYDRIPFSELERRGKKRTIRLIGAAVTIILAVLRFYEEIVAQILGLE